MTEEEVIERLEALYMSLLGQLALALYKRDLLIKNRGNKAVNPVGSGGDS